MIFDGTSWPLRRELRLGVEREGRPGLAALWAVSCRMLGCRLMIRLVDSEGLGSRGKHATLDLLTNSLVDFLRHLEVSDFFGPCF